MILTNTTLGKFMAVPSYREGLYETHVKGYKDRVENHGFNPPQMYHDDQEAFFHNARSVIHGGWKEAEVFVIRKTAREIIDKINLKEERTFSYLERMTDDHFIYMVDQDTFIKFAKGGPTIVVVAVRMDQKTGYARYTMFNFDIESGYESGTIDLRGDGFEKEIRDLFLKTLIFILFTEQEIVHLPPGRKTGTRAQGKVINDSKFPVTVVDSSWNKFLIRNEPFDVRGHLAIRACGVGRKDRRLTWINPYTKSGYKRKAKKA